MDRGPEITSVPFLAPASRAGEGAAQAGGGARTVLVVEDDGLMRSLLARTLSALGVEAVLAANGREALALGPDELGRVALVLLDFKLPEMNAPAVFSELRRRRPGIPVVAMSGYGPCEGAFDPGSQPPIGYLAKPFRRDALAAVVREALLGAPGRGR